MSQLNSLYILDSKKEVSCPQTHNFLLTGYGAPRSPSASRDPITGLLWDWVKKFETPTAIPQYDNLVFFVFFSVMSHKNITAEVHLTFIMYLQKRFLHTLDDIF